MRPDYYGNYYGTYLASMGLYDGTPARPVLPVFEKMSSLCVIQPFSNYARNPPVAYIQAVVDIFRELSGEEVYVIGLPTTERILKNVRYDLLATSLPRLMQIVQNARIVLTPRSLSAHVAAGYGTPSVVWCPNDKENWHLDYPNWSRETRLYEDGVDAIRDAIVKVWDIVKKFDISS
jgi:ADP-heptose:LPS heptosyltransferase